MASRLRCYIRQNHLALIALVVAVVGVPTAWAVARNSIGSPQIKKNAVKNSDLADNSVGSREVIANSLKGSDIRESSLSLAAEPWKPLPFLAGWSSYGGLFEVGGYRKDPVTGRVDLRGLVTRSSGTPVSSSVIATLPEGYEPQDLQVFSVTTGEPSAAGRIDISEDGIITWIAGSTGEADFTSLSGLSFWTD